MKPILRNQIIASFVEEDQPYGILPLHLFRPTTYPKVLFEDNKMDSSVENSYSTYLSLS